MRAVGGADVLAPQQDLESRLELTPLGRPLARRADGLTRAGSARALTGAAAASQGSALLSHPPHSPLRRWFHIRNDCTFETISRVQCVTSITQSGDRRQ